MKLVKRSEESTFYESFSDLIFTTMTIFIFLMIVFLTQLRPAGVKAEDLQKVKDQNKHLQELLEQASTELDAASKAKDKVEAELKKALKEIADVAAIQPIELVIVIDGSATMTAAFQALSQAMAKIMEEIPEVAPKLEVGIIVYRDQLSLFPIKTIYPRSIDGGASARSVINFITKEAPANQPADILGGMRKADEWLRSSKGKVGKQVLILVGDVGPYELGGQQSLGVRDSNEIPHEKLLIDLVVGLGRFNQKLSFLIVFRFPAPNEQNSSGLLREYTNSLFQQMATSLDGGRSRMEYETSSMLSHILLSILATDSR